MYFITFINNTLDIVFIQPTQIQSWKAHNVNNLLIKKPFPSETKARHFLSACRKNVKELADARLCITLS